MKKEPPRPPKKSPESFRDYAGAVRPLEPRSSRVPPPKRAPASGQLEAPRPIFDVSDDGRTIRGVRRGFADVLSRLEEGRFATHDSLDLHGLHSDEARKALLRFCKDARGTAKRAILVVHGKGTHSPAGRGILRDEMAEWLSSPPLAEHVLCFATARAKHGGAGAVYVLLAPWR